MDITTLPTFVGPRFLSPDDSDDADLTIVSAEGVRFRVHSYMLKANSLSFLDMLYDMPSGANIYIFTDDLTDTLAGFLFLMYHVVTKPLADPPTAVAIYKMSIKYECHIMSHRMVVIVLDYFAELLPWDSFVCACQFDDLPAARAALRNMGTDAERSNMTHLTIPPVDTLKLPISWYIGLRAALVGSSIPGSEYRWEDIATRFKPWH